MEVRRAQGFPDHEVLIGPPGEQWKMVGNSIAHHVALALSVSLCTKMVHQSWFWKIVLEDGGRGGVQMCAEQVYASCTRGFGGYDGDWISKLRLAMH